ncbi:WD40 repeat domain-containing serine/threonine-protein kinase [Nonomuraea typhae]|uniref:WD40 repeat domain-containing serine/threonine-protein kinase n=1 Tax=Nonomuraea typhae TaxID=2603600 RepID=UPI0012FC08A5|nr:WD40 repeat domain-containing serine/threonine-protein kinase [Nonomuraea typhae]
MADALIDGDPERLGGYWLAGRVGEGGQGVVYEGYDEKGDRVAIKVFRGDPSAQPRLAREAAAARRVPPFCTARVLDADLDGPRPYIVSEYVEGPSLRQAARVFAGDDLHRLATAMATALTAIHDAGVVHRDLKPDNVLLGPDGPRVIDFGVARTLEMSLTSAQVLAGTPSYMAPEVFSGERARTAADVFAWGATVLFAATGQDPFRADWLGAVMHRVLSHEPDLSVLPEPLRELVGAALAKDPGERPTARELLLGLVSGDGLDTARLLAQGAGTADGTGPVDAVGSAGPAGSVRRTASHGHAAGRGAHDHHRPFARDPALSTLAEDAYAALGPAERELVPELFLRLVTVTDTGDLAVRQAARTQLPAGMGPVLQAFAYLVSAGDPVRLLRPALPLAWPRLRAWIQADRDGLALYQRIAAAATSWAGGGRRDADLLHGSTLDTAQRWAATGRRHITLTPAERDFLEAGAALARRRGRRVRVLSVALAGMLALALAGGGVAVYQSGRVAEQRDLAESRQLAALADSVRLRDPVLGMLLSVAAHDIAATPQATAAMQHGLTSAATRSFTDPAAVAVRALSADGRRLFSASDGEVRVWDTRTGRRTAAFRHQGGDVIGMAASPSGRTLALATGREGVRLWDTATGAALRPRYRLFEGAADYDFALSYSASEDVVVVRMGQGATFWNTRTGAKTQVSTLGGDLEVTPDGKTAWYTLMGDVLRRRPLPRGREKRIRPCPRTCQNFALSPDGTKLAVPGPEQEIERLIAGSGKESDRSLSGWKGGALSWSGDLVAALGDNGLQVWRTGDATMILNEPVVPGAADLAFDPAGHDVSYLAGDTVVSSGLDPWPRQGQGAQLLSSDGTRLLAGRTVRNLTTGKTITLPEDTVYPRAFNATGSAIATGGDTAVTVHDTTTGRRLAELPLGDEAPQAVAFSPDGARLAVSAQTYIRLADLAGRRIWQVPSTMTAELAFTPDGRHLFTGDGFLDAATGRPAATQPLGKGVRGLSFSTDGTVFGWPDGSARMAFWRRGTPEPSSAPLRDLPAQTQLTFSPDGALVAAVDVDGARVYDVASGIPLTTITDPSISQAGFSGGRLLVLADEKLAEYPMDPATVSRRVCARAGRSLTEAEWAAYVPSLPYRTVCGR